MTTVIEDLLATSELPDVESADEYVGAHRIEGALVRLTSNPAVQGIVADTSGDDYSVVLPDGPWWLSRYDFEVVR